MGVHINEKLIFLISSYTSISIIYKNVVQFWQLPFTLLEFYIKLF